MNTKATLELMRLVVLLALTLLVSCGELLPEPEPEPTGLPSGYWVTMCRCQPRPYPGEGTKRGAKCASGFKYTELCESDGVIWCGTGEWWGERCK